MAVFIYELVNRQNTYAWIKLTAISNPTNAINIVNGTRVIVATIIPDVNNVANNPDKIFRRV